MFLCWVCLIIIVACDVVCECGVCVGSLCVFVFVVFLSFMCSMCNCVLACVDVLFP